MFLDRPTIRADKFLCRNIIQNLDSESEIANLNHSRLIAQDQQRKLKVKYKKSKGKGNHNIHQKMFLFSLFSSQNRETRKSRPIPVK